MLFSFLLDIANFLRDLLEGVFVSGILDLEVWVAVEKIRQMPRQCVFGLEGSPCCFLGAAACDAMIID